MNWTDDFFAGRNLENRAEAVTESLGSAQDAGTYPRDPFGMAMREHDSFLDAAKV
jgi:hypothetical protein